MKKYLRIIVYIALAAVLITGVFLFVRYRANKSNLASSADTFSPRLNTLIKKAEALENEGSLIQAKEQYQKILMKILK